MPRWICCLPLILLACEPPPDPLADAGAGGGEPAIEMIHPPRDVGIIPLNGDRLEVFLTVAIYNLEFFSPDEPRDDAEGEGHWHLNVNGVYRDAPAQRFHLWRSQAGEFEVGDRVQLSATLSSNMHRDLDMFDDWIDVIEFNVGEEGDGGGLLSGIGGASDDDDDDDGGSGYTIPMLQHIPAARLEGADAAP